VENSNRLLEEVLLERKIPFGIMDISHLLSGMLLKKQQSIIYGIRVEVDAYIP